MLPEKEPSYPEFAGQAVALPALLDLLDQGLQVPTLHRVLMWMGRWDLLWIGTDMGAEAVPEGATTLAEIEAQTILEAARAEGARILERNARIRAENYRARHEMIVGAIPQTKEIKIVPLSPGGCPAAQELADGKPASEGPSCESGQDGEGGGVIPSPPPEPEDAPEDDDGAWPIEDETDPAAPPPPCAAEEGAPLPVIEGAPTPAETVPEAVPAGDRNGQPWTAEEDALALSLRSKGKSVRQIAEALGRSHSSTSYNLYSRILKAHILKAQGAPKNSEKLGGERGGLQRLDPAEHDPVQGATAEDATVAPEAAPPVAPVERPAWWAEVEQLLAAIGTKGGWTAARDLILVDGRAKGFVWSLICDELGVEVREAKARLVALTPNGGGEAELERLTEVLRARAAREGGAQ